MPRLTDKLTMLPKEPKPKAGPKPRKCAVKSCRREYVPYSSMVKWCSFECGAILAQQLAEAKRLKEARKQRAEDKKKREAMATIPELKKRAQKAFNAFIRERDKGMPCICCGKWPQSDSLTGGDFDAGHYRSTGSADHLRFNENNCHAQLKACNRYGAGRAVDYRIGLIRRIGLTAVEALEADNQVIKWNREMLLEIEATYKAKLKALKG